MYHKHYYNKRKRRYTYNGFLMRQLLSRESLAVMAKAKGDNA